MLTLASYPTFDPNTFSRYPPAAWKNHAIADVFEPGSTFKMVTAAAAFESLKVSPEDPFFCENGHIVLGKTRINDHKSFGLLTFREVIAKSSNVGVIKAALIIGDEPLHSMITGFGFGRRTGIDLPGESPGIVHPVSQLEPDRQGLHLVRPGHLGDAAAARQRLRRARQRRCRPSALPGARDRTRRRGRAHRAAGGEGSRGHPADRDDARARARDA